MTISIRAVPAILALSLTLGCASSGDESGAGLAANEDGLVCRFERETGSHFKKRVCKTRQQLDEERANALSLQNAIQGGSSPDTSTR